MPGEIIELFIIKQTSLHCALFGFKAVEHSRSGRKCSTASCVFPYTSFVLYRFQRALLQKRAQSRLLYLLNIISYKVMNSHRTNKT